MKYKTGDKVFIKTEEELLESGWVPDDKGFYKPGYFLNITSAMRMCFGKCVTIKKSSDDCYKIYEDNEWWKWTEDMFSEEKMKAMKIKKALETLSE